MTNGKPSDLRGNCGQAGLAAMGLRSGIAKDKLVFIIIFSAAVAVALVTMLTYLLSGPKLGAPVPWQCVDCDYEFSSRTVTLPPIDCSKCGGQAVRTYYRSCPGCKKEVILLRQRRSSQDQAQPAFITGRPGGWSPAMEFQYWHKQPDDSYAWSDWLHPLSPPALQIKADLQCPYCGAKLNPSAR